MSKSTLHASIEKVMDFLLSIAPSVIVWPESNVEKDHLASEFEQVMSFCGL